MSAHHPCVLVANFPGWLPGMGFKEKARRYREQYFSLAEEGHQMVKDDIVSCILLFEATRLLC